MNNQKPTIEKKLEGKTYCMDCKGKCSSQHPHNKEMHSKGYIYFKDDLNLAIQNTMKELKKKRFCIRCDYNIEHDYDVENNKTIHKYGYYESDLEKAFGGIKNGKR